MATVQCLSCDAMNDAIATGGYCDNCGKRLPATALLRTKRSMTAGPDGTNVPQDPAVRSRYAVSEGLYAAAIVHLVAGAAFLMLGPMLLAKVPENFFPLVVGWAMTPSLIVGLLGGAARFAPRPALVGSALTVLAFAASTFALEPTVAPTWLAVEAVTFAVILYAAYAGRPSP